MKIDELYALLRRRGVLWPSAEIYGGAQGLYDYGPLGAALKRRLEDAWAAWFLGLSRDYYLIQPSEIVPEAVVRASGHLENFTDPEVTCESCHASVRAETLLEKERPQGVDGLTPAQIGEILRVHKVRCPTCGSNALGVPRPFNLMFSIPWGAGQRGAGLPAPRDGPGELPRVRAHVGRRAEGTPARSSGGRQGIPQRDRSPAGPLPNAGVHAGRAADLLRPERLRRSLRHRTRREGTGPPCRPSGGGSRGGRGALAVRPRRVGPSRVLRLPSRPPAALPPRRPRLSGRPDPILREVREGARVLQPDPVRRGGLAREPRGLQGGRRDPLPRRLRPIPPRGRLRQGLHGHTEGRGQGPSARAGAHVRHRPQPLGARGCSPRPRRRADRLAAAAVPRAGSAGGVSADRQGARRRRAPAGRRDGGGGRARAVPTKRARSASGTPGWTRRARRTA